MQTSGGVTGTFNNVEINNIIPQYDVIYYPDDIWLLLGSSGLPATSPS